MREARSAEIDGVTFTLQQLPGMRSVKLMHKLAKAGGPALLKAFSSGSALAQDVSVLGFAAQEALDRFSADDLEALIKELFETGTMTHAGGVAPIMPIFNDALAGKPGTILKALKFGLEVNYGDFLGELLASAGALAKANPSPLKAI